MIIKDGQELLDEDEMIAVISHFAEQGNTTATKNLQRIKEIGFKEFFLEYYGDEAKIVHF